MAIKATAKNLGSGPASPAPTYLRELVLRAENKTLCIVASSTESWDSVLKALNADAPNFEDVRRSALDRDKPAAKKVLGAPPKQWAVVAIPARPDREALSADDYEKANDRWEACRAKAGEVFESLGLLASALGVDRSRLDVLISRARHGLKRERFAVCNGVTFCLASDYLPVCEALNIEPRLDEVHPVLVKLGLVENNS